MTVNIEDSRCAVMGLLKCHHLMAADSEESFDSIICDVQYYTGKQRADKLVINRASQTSLLNILSCFHLREDGPLAMLPKLSVLLYQGRGYIHLTTNL